MNKKNGRNWLERVVQTNCCNKIGAMIMDKASKCGLHNYMPRIVDIVYSMDEEAIKKFYCLYTFTTEYAVDCLKQNFEFAIEMTDKTDKEIVDEAISIIKQNHETHKADIYKGTNYEPNKVL